MRAGGKMRRRMRRRWKKGGVVGNGQVGNKGGSRKQLGRERGVEER